MVKPIVVESSFIPNLLQFTLVGLEAGGFHKMAHPPYRDECSSWISQKQKNLFSDVFSKLEGVSSSTWFALLYQIPAYLAEDSLDSLIEVIQLLSRRDTISVIEEYPKKTALIERYIPLCDFMMYLGYDGAPTKAWSELLIAYSEIVEDIYNRLYAERWTSIRTSLESVKNNLLDGYLGGFDWIGWWEDRTGIDFVYPLFQVELIDAMTTMGTSLLAERDGFYAHASSLKIATMVSHEICTHMLFSADALKNDVVAPLIREDLENYLRTVEVFSWAINKELIQSRDLDWTMESSFDWIGPNKDRVASLIEKDSETHWELMREGYSLMKNE